MRFRSLLFACVALGATVPVVSAQPSVSTSTSSTAAIACIQTCNERVQPGDTVPCGQDGIDCTCTPPNLADALFYCFQALCPDSATEADNIMTKVCTCDTCSIRIQANQLVITGGAGASILSLPAAAPPASTPPTSGTASPGTVGGTGTATGGTGSATGGQGGQGGAANDGTGGSSSSSSSSSSNSAGSTGAKPADPAVAGSDSKTATSSKDTPSPSTSPDPKKDDDSAALALVSPAATGWLVLAALGLIAVV